MDLTFDSNLEMLASVAAAEEAKSPDPNPLVEAITTGNKELVDQMLNHPDTDVNKARTDGFTPLMAAARYGMECLVDRLLDHPDIDVNKADIDDWQSQYYPNQSSCCGDTALTLAIEGGHMGVVDRLLAHPKIDVNKGKCQIGSTCVSPLLVALQKGNSTAASLPIFEKLLAHPNIDVMSGPCNGCTALFWASLECYTEMVDLLLARPEVHPHIHTVSRSGYTALSLALRDGHTEIVERLLEHTPEEMHHVSVNPRFFVDCLRILTEEVSTQVVVVLNNVPVYN